jgi:ACGX-repeat protein
LRANTFIKSLTTKKLKTMKRSNEFGFGHSAQHILSVVADAPSACGSACGAGDKKEEKPAAACGSACGAGDKEEKKPAPACGSACGAGSK